MSRRRENIFMAVTMILAILLFCVKLTGDIWHAVIGVMLVLMCVSHSCMQMVKMKYQEKRIRLTDEVLMGALAVLSVTGMLMHPLQGVLLVKILHKLSGMVFILGLITHILQHKKLCKKTERSGHVS